jgi:hypothetical protein
VFPTVFFGPATVHSQEKKVRIRITQWFRASRSVPVAAALSVASMGTLAHANSISINFEGGNPGLAVDSSGSAGAPGAAQTGNWNNLASPGTTLGTVAGSATGGTGALIDNTGAATNATLTYSYDFTNGNSYATGASATSEDLELMNGFIAINGASGNNLTTIPLNLANVPYANYNVYVYFGSTGSNHAGSTTDNLGQTYSFTTDAYQYPDPYPGYVQTTSATGNPFADYAVFTNETSPTLNLGISIPTAGNGVGVFGVQIVSAVPEPASLGLIGVSALGLLRRRVRRHR